MKYVYDYCKLGDFTYHVLTDSKTIKSYMMEWIMAEWESDNKLAPDEHWTVAWMDVLPSMEFDLEILPLMQINPNKDMMSVADFQRSLKERADEREESVLRGISIEPLLVNRKGFELMDGYTRHTVLKRYDQMEVYAYLGSA